MTDNDTLRERFTAFATQWVKGSNRDDEIYTFVDRAGEHTLRASDLIAAAEAITQLQAKVERLETALEPVAAMQTVKEMLEGDPIEWDALSLNERIEAIGRRKDARDAAILAARNALSDKVGG